MILRIASFIPAAWAVFMVFYLNRDRHQGFHYHSGGPFAKLTVGIVILNLLIAVPVRAVRLVATSLLFVFVGVLVFEVGLWWLPGLIVAVVVTAADYSTRLRRNFPVFLSVTLLACSVLVVSWAHNFGRGPGQVVVREGNFSDSVFTDHKTITPPRGPVTPIPPGAVLVTICPPASAPCSAAKTPLSPIR